MKEQSYVMVKPEFANNPEVVEEVRNRLVGKGLEIKKAGYINYDKERAARHYHEHVGKSFYPELEEYITSDKAYGMIVEGENAISIIRELAGATKNPVPGTIRYDIPEKLGIERRVTQNVVHSSDSKESAELEIGIFKELMAEKSFSK
ncbi:MAG: nucleoside-diphosphate kinase [Candidatus Caccovivens sp.]